MFKGIAEQPADWISLENTSSGILYMQISKYTLVNWKVKPFSVSFSIICIVSVLSGNPDGNDS